MSAPETFDRVTEAQLRTRTCAKWHTYPDDVLPLWVADMDFPVADEIKRAIVRQLEADDLGYGPRTGVPDLRESVVDRVAERFGWVIACDDVLPTAGIAPGLALGSLVLAGRDEEIVLQPPVYPPFFAAVEKTGRCVLENPMLVEDGRYRFDLDGLRRAITPRTRALMLCNPQNPTGRVFTRAELEALAEVVLEHDLHVISDELHADLVLDGVHVPFASLSPEVDARTLTLYGPTKAFNIAGLKIGFAIASNHDLLERMRAAAAAIVPGPTTPAQHATVGAYRHAGAWLEGTLAYLRANRDHLAARLQREAPVVGLRPPEGTYLAWLDMRALGLGADLDAALKGAGVALNDGLTFGTGGAGFARLNFATSRSILDAAIDRLVALVRAHAAATPATVR
jgi:cysteine-S-conjugate beta-lyase